MNGYFFYACLSLPVASFCFTLGLFTGPAALLQLALYVYLFPLRFDIWNGR